MKRVILIPLTAALLALGAAPGRAGLAQQSTLPGLAQLTESGHIFADGHSVPYLIRRLPVSSFPALPEEVANVLNERSCMIPQTYEAHRPENVVRASLEHAGSSDWAVLCAVKGKVSLLVFMGSDPGQPTVLASVPETDRLQAHDPTGVLGFNWGIDPASPERVHDAQAGMDHRPPLLNHDALADSVVEHRTIYHYYANNAWTLLDMPQ